MCRELKDSGIPWIGEIPKDWNVSRYKFFATSRMGETILAEDTTESGIPIYSATQDGKIFGYIEIPKIILHKDDLVIPARGNSIGCISRVKEDVATCTQTTICSYNIRNINSSFLYHCGWGLKDEWFKYDGSAIPQVTVNQVNNNYLPLPPLAEQQRIAEFLDRKCAEVDEMIALQELIIEELKAYKQSVVTEAVTKGLNPAAPMRDSGIEWIGSIPEHWEVCRVKNVASLFGRIGFRGYTSDDLNKDGEGAITLSPSNMLPMGMDYTNVTYLSWMKYHESPEIMIQNGDILMVKTGSSYGKVSYVNNLPKEATINPQILRIVSRINSKYLGYYLQTPLFIYQVEGGVVGGTIPTISQEKINNFFVAMPSIEEQQAIADYLDEKCADIDSLIQTKQSKIDSLKEYKKSIIYEYVTGKREVE